MNSLSAPAEYRVHTEWGVATIGERAGRIVSVTAPGSRRRADGSALAAAPPRVRQLGEALESYFDGDPHVELVSRSELETWLDAAGVAGFRRDVSLALFEVPSGVTVTYGELAALAGRPGAARAAGTTCARNPLPLVIPCHRVVRAGARLGDVGQYGAELAGSAGPAMKRRLLELEGAAFVRPRAMAVSGS